MVGINAANQSSGDHHIEALQGSISFPGEPNTQLARHTNETKEDIVHNVLAQQPSYIKEFWTFEEVKDVLGSDMVKDTNIFYADVLKNMINVRAAKHIAPDVAHDDKVYKIMKRINQIVSEYCDYADHNLDHAFDRAILKKPSRLNSTAVPYYKNLLGKLCRIAYKKGMHNGFVHLTTDPEEEMRTTQRVNKELKAVLGGQKVMFAGNPSNEELREYIKMKKESKNKNASTRKAA